MNDESTPLDDGNKGSDRKRTWISVQIWFLSRISTPYALRAPFTSLWNQNWRRDWQMIMDPWKGIMDPWKGIMIVGLGWRFEKWGTKNADNDLSSWRGLETFITIRRAKVTRISGRLHQLLASKNVPTVFRNDNVVLILESWKTVFVQQEFVDRIKTKTCWIDMLLHSKT